MRKFFNSEFPIFWMLALSLALSFSSCQKSQPDVPDTPGTEDKGYWPFEACIDSTDRPGNDFYKYASLGYTRVFGSGYMNQLEANASEFVSEELVNPTSSALQALNKWGDISASEIQKREVAAYDSYSKSLQDFSVAQMIGMIAHNALVACPSFINTSVICAEHRLRLISVLSTTGLSYDAASLTAMANYIGMTPESLAAYSQKMTPLINLLAPIIKEEAGVALEVQKMKEEPGYLPEDIAEGAGNDITTKAGSEPSTAVRILLSAFGLNEDDTALLMNYKSTLDYVEKAINAILAYPNPDEMRDAMAAYLNLAYLNIAYVTTYTSQTNPKVSIANFYSSRFCRQLMGDEYIIRKVEASYAKPLQEMASQLRSTFDSRLDSLDWMSPSTKVYAKKKLDAMYFWFGMPKNPASTFDVAVDDSYLNTCPSECYIALGDKFLKDILIPQMHKTTLDDDMIYLAMCGELSSMPFSANAFYNMMSNTMNILACHLVARHENSTYSDAFYYGTIGFAIGHEMCHGFDANGSKFNADGAEENWWAVSDKLKYKEKQTALINLFDQYEFVDQNGKICQISGSQTLTENMADFGGMTVSYDAFCRLRKSQGYDEAGMREQKRRFFLSYAMMWSENTPYYNHYYSKPTDNHSPHVIRVNAINQLDDWYDIFGVQWGDKYYLEPKQRVALW